MQRKWGEKCRLVTVALLLCSTLGCRSPIETADLLLVNGSVYSFAWGEPGPEGTPAPDAPYADGWSPDAEAVAVRGDRIVFVGGTSEAERYRGEGTRVIDLGGATVLPGLVDSHTHVEGLGRREEQADLTGIDTEEEAIARVEAHVRDEGLPASGWIVGGGWDEGAWANRYPTMEKLTAAFPDHPVVLHSLHGFAVWGNARAFEEAGLDAETPDPDGGKIERYADGRPSGVVLNRAGNLLTRAIPETSAAERRAHLLSGLERMARDGYVAVHEAGLSGDQLAALEELDAAGDLPVRVYAMLSARDEPLCREWIAAGPRSGMDSRLAVRSVKAYYDGALGSRGARLIDDYADRPGHRGVSGAEYGFDRELVAEMMRSGFQVGIHAIGDAGNRETLEFIEEVLADSPEARAERHRIEHAQVIHPDDFDRFAASGIVASMEPPHAVEDMTWAEERLGAERIRGAYAWRTLRRAGAALTFNSDLTGSDHSIFYGLHAAITRRNKDRQPTDGWYAEQSLTPEEAVRAYTGWSAYAAHWEAETGALLPGRWADLTVLDVDPLALGETDPGAILEGRVVATIVGGEVVFQADTAPPAVTESR